MKRISVLLALSTALAAFMVAGATASLPSSVVYNAVPSPLPPNVASLGFQATSTSQFGDYVHLAGTDRVLDSVTVTMSNWALYSDYTSDARYSGDSAYWTHPITVNVWDDDLDGNGVPTTLLATETQVVTIPWRPAADPTCPNGTAWRAGDGNCYNGIAFNATFDMSSPAVTLPDDVIVGVAYNTNTWDSYRPARPIRVPQCWCCDRSDCKRRHRQQHRRCILGHGIPRLHGRLPCGHWLVPQWDSQPPDHCHSDSSWTTDQYRSVQERWMGVV